MYFKNRDRITYDELTHLIEPLKIEFNLSLNNNPTIVNNDYYQTIHEIKMTVLNKVLPSVNNRIKEEIANSWPISFIPHKEGYSISLSPKVLIETIFNKMRLIDNKFSFYNLDEEYDKKIFINSINNRINKISNIVYKLINNNDYESIKKYINLNNRDINRYCYYLFNPLLTDLSGDIP